MSGYKLFFFLVPCLFELYSSSLVMDFQYGGATIKNEIKSSLQYYIKKKIEWFNEMPDIVSNMDSETWIWFSARLSEEDNARHVWK